MRLFWLLAVLPLSRLYCASTAGEGYMKTLWHLRRKRGKPRIISSVSVSVPLLSTVNQIKEYRI